MANKVAGSYNIASSKTAYEDFYSGRDFRHFGYSDRLLIQTLVTRYTLTNKLLMDLGSGTGWYTHLFNTQGVHAFGVELSMSGNLRAKGRYAAQHSCVTGDGLALPIATESLDAVFCSGFPPFNTEDLGALHELGQRLFAVLKHRGIFIFRKTTDLSGRKTSRMNHPLQDYIHYFQHLGMGTIIDTFAESPVFWPVLRRLSFSRMGTAVNVLFTKLTGWPLRAVVVVRRSR